MGDDAIRWPNPPKENPFKSFLPDLRRDLGGAVQDVKQDVREQITGVKQDVQQQIQGIKQDIRQQIKDTKQELKQELRTTVHNAETELLGAVGVRREGKTFSGNLGGVDFVYSGSNWSTTVGDFSLARSRTGFDTRLGDFRFGHSRDGFNASVDGVFEVADSKSSGWSVKVGRAIDFQRSPTDTRFRLFDPESETSLTLNKTPTERMLDFTSKELGTSVRVEKSPSGNLYRLESDGVVFEVRRTGPKYSVGLTSLEDKEGVIFTQDPITKTISFQDVHTGSVLSVQKTATGTFKVEESFLPRINFQPRTLLEGLTPPRFPLPALTLDTDVFDGQGHLRLRADLANASARYTGDLGPLTISVEGTQAYSLPNIFTREGRAHPVDSILGDRRLDVTAMLRDELGAGLTLTNDQKPSVRLIRGLGEGSNFFVEGGYNWEIRKGTFGVSHKFKSGWLIRLNAAPGTVGAELRYEPGQR